MQNPCVFPATRKRLVCEFPPCNCQKCTKLRSEGKPDQHEISKCFRSSSDTTLKEADEYPDTSINETTNGSKKLAKAKLLGIQNLHLPSINFTPSNLQSVLFDIVGIISFFIMATIMFWLSISQYLWKFVKMIFQWGRRGQLTTLILLLLLCMSITFHAIKGAHRHQHKSPPLVKPTVPALSHNSTSDSHSLKCPHYKSCQRKRCSHMNLQNSSKNSRNCGLGSSENLLAPNKGNKFDNNIKTNNKQCDKCNGNKLEYSSSSNSNLGKKQNPSLCDLCAQHMKHEVRPILSDDEAREMYKRFKLYAIPSEMKTPPSIGILIEFLSGLYNTISGSMANTPP